jgi:membrane-associated protein
LAGEPLDFSHPSSGPARFPDTMIDLAKKLIDFILHIDVHLLEITREYGGWTYAVLFLIIFAETGLVVTPFLPGDSLLFAAGALCARADSGLNVHTLALLLFVAAVIGDTLNYWIGSKLGPAVFKREDSLFFKKKNLERAHAFFEKYGGRAIILARFMPIVRTFVPFVAGVGRMNYRQFLTYNIVGGFIWIYSLTYAGYAFGNHPLVQKNFKLVIVGIIVLSVLPIVYEFIQAWRQRKKEGGPEARAD